MLYHPLSALFAGAIVEIADNNDPAASLVQIDVGTSKLIARITKRSQQRLGIAVGQSVWVQVKTVALVRL